MMHDEIICTCETGVCPIHSEWAYYIKGNRINHKTHCPNCLILRSLVLEMGKHIPLAISDRMGGWQAAKNSLAEILNRPEVKAIITKAR